MVTIIYNATVWFCEKLIHIGVIPECRKKIYVYGFELMFSSAVGIFCLAVLSALVGKPFAWIPYLAGFIPLRITGGGYHAKTHFSCIMSFSLVFLLLLVLCSVICQMSYINLLFAGMALGAAYYCAPVEAVNRPLSKAIQLKNRKRCLCIACINTLTSFAVLITRVVCGIYTVMYYAGAFSAGISMIVVFFGNYKNRKHFIM